MLPLLFTALASAVWVGLLLDPARRWDFQPVESDPLSEPDPKSWPSVAILVPARNEAEALPQTLPSLFSQDYPGPFHVWVIDDRSEDDTTGTARRLADGQPGTVIRRETATPGWVGKVGALEAGLACMKKGGLTDYLLCTDADILHTPDSLRCLVKQSEAYGLALNSRMARLRCISPAERLAIPAFVYFFNLLYPMRRINDSGHPAGAAGGCVLLSRQAMASLGNSFASIRECVIDDVNLARAIHKRGGRLRLELSAGRVTSLRTYPEMRDIGAMVSRSAYAQLGYRPWLGWLTPPGLAFLFFLPPAAALAGLWMGHPALAGLGAVGWLAMTISYLPAIRFFQLPWVRVLTLPLAALHYAAMTWQSMRRHEKGGGVRWRDTPDPL